MKGAKRYGKTATALKGGVAVCGYINMRYLKLLTVHYDYI